MEKVAIIVFHKFLDIFRKVFLNIYAYMYYIYNKHIY